MIRFTGLLVASDRSRRQATSCQATDAAIVHPKTLRFLLIAVLLVTQIAVIAFVMVSMQRVTTSQFISNAYGRVQAMAGALATQARQYLEPAESSLVVMLDLFEDGTLDAREATSLETHFLMELRLNESVQGVELARSDGSFVAVYRDGDALLTRISAGYHHASSTMVSEYDSRANLIQQSRRTSPDGDRRRQPWYRDALASRSLVWTDPYLLFSTRSPGLSVAMKLPGVGRIPDSVLAVHVDVSNLSAIVSDIPNAQGGSAAVVDEAFNTIAWSEPSRPLSQADGHGVLPLGRIAGQPMKALQRLVSTPRNTVDEESNGFLRFVVNGEQHVGIARPFELAGGRVNWTLMVQAPTIEYAGGLQAYFVNWLWTLIGVIIVTTLMALLAIMRLTAPVYEMHRNATRDRLTGALSRSEFQRRFASLARRRSHRAKGQHTALVAIDFDGFKAVNDQYGHAAGDQVLVEIASRLRTRLRRQDLLGRIGGDEFVIAMQLDRELDAAAAIERLRASVVASAVQTDAGHHEIGITAGIALRRSDESLDTVMARADHALVSGKAKEKNRSYHAAPNAGGTSGGPSEVAHQSIRCRQPEPATPTPPRAERFEPSRTA